MGMAACGMQRQICVLGAEGYTVEGLANVQRLTWTPEMDERLAFLAASQLSSTQTAALMGVSKESVKKRAARIGVRFGRYSGSQRGCAGGHRAADARSAELLRQAGVRIWATN